MSQNDESVGAISYPYRLACGRCGSQQVVRQQSNGKWECGQSHVTPAVYDLLVERWKHVGEDSKPSKNNAMSFKQWPGGSGFP